MMSKERSSWAMMVAVQSGRGSLHVFPLVKVDLVRGSFVTVPYLDCFEMLIA